MALVTIRRSSIVQSPPKTGDDETIENEENVDNNIKSLNECYFANKGAALVLGGGADWRRSPARSLPQPDIQHHLQAMFYLLRPEETLKMAVKLESGHPGRTRFLVVVCHGEEAALLGIDCNHRTTVGLVLRVLADTSIKLDGDGSALQTLHRAGGRARALNHFAGGPSHAWAAHYERRVDSDRSCLNEWHAMDCLESRRPPSPDSLRLKPRERDETERVIRSTLKEIMMSVDLDDVTSKAIRGRLEDDLDMDLAEYKSFIDQEMLTILGQMDAPTEVFEHVYLGSEWNASNLDELHRNGVRHILNVTREIDNFFPGMFDYLNIRVYDDEKTDLLKHWDNTFKYINKARNEGSKVLVHCKMGISRSASVVIAYAMKAYNWNFDKALKHVKAKRGCIKPNTNFLNQLETYQGILDAMKNKEKLQRSKSETNLKSPKSSSKAESKTLAALPLAARGGARPGRPRSWSPLTALGGALLPPTSVSLEHLAPETRHMLMPCANGSYSVSPNQIIRLKEEGALSVRHIVSEIENAAGGERREGPRRPPRPQPAEPPRPTRTHAWDPGEPDGAAPHADSDLIVKSDSGIIDVKTKTNDYFCNSVDRNLDCEEKKPPDEQASPPSRQSSWSSFDSAVVPDLSRHSSWGSYDTRRGARDEPPLRRISERAHRQRADNERKFNETCAILEQLAAAAARPAWRGRLSASAPADTWLRAAPRRRRLAAASHGDLSAPPAPGLVRNLKKEFEALGGSAPTRGPARCETESRRPPPRAPERPSERPPVAPTVVSMNYPNVLVSTVMSKAQNKKQLQHGKTHPLTRLNMNRSNNNRCSNPVYNTM